VTAAEQTKLAEQPYFSSHLEQSAAARGEGDKAQKGAARAAEPKTSVRIAELKTAAQKTGEDSGSEIIFRFYLTML